MKYAFIDFQNTDTTTKKLLGFVVDWKKLFEFLIRNVIAKGAKVHIVSSGRKIKSGPQYFTSRFSTKLRKLCAERSDSVNFLEIDNLKKRIEKV